MTESMKFGPEWLRALSSQQPARYQLAEFRYGREEMLALFSANLPPPESLKNLHGLYVEKAQPPLALNTMSDEETRMWNRGINSDAVLRSVGKGERGGGLRGSGGGGAGGRGGRGRGAFYRGGTERYEEGGDAPFARQRPFDRSQSERGRDSWSERNGGEGRGGGREREPNWRRGQRSGGGGDEDDWRPYSSSNKWNVSGGRSNNWREEDSYDMNQSHSGKNSNHHLPEWATEKNSEGGGTFDSSGAFHGPSEHSEEEEPKKNENRISGKEKDRERDKEKGSSNKNEILLMRERNEKKVEAKESPKESKSPDKEENGIQKPETTPPRVESPKRAPLISQQHPQTTNSLPSPQQSQSTPPLHSIQQHQQSNRAVKTPSPPLQTAVPTPSPAERKSPPQQPVQIIQQPPQPQPVVHEHKSPPHHIHQPPPPIHQPSLEHQEDVLSNMTDDLAADLVAKLMEDEEKQDKQWFYRDPQGEVQGPFTCTEMAEWFQSGYFTLNLLVRRACDPNYAPLGELIKLWGCIPFLPEFHPLIHYVSGFVFDEAL
ncbi:unnamed protein product [Nezara viridula]|uniref:GYF domain-containing protein n=1 Tax=Nezara viridula TaxID=85310 RepID=A0A9P0H274_NEZVI|nr:unnamed protein product [Nezara viridula]